MLTLMLLIVINGKSMFCQYNFLIIQDISTKWCPGILGKCLCIDTIKRVIK